MQIAVSQVDGTPWIVNGQDRVSVWNGAGWTDETAGSVPRGPELGPGGGVHLARIRFREDKGPSSGCHCVVMSVSFVGFSST